MPWYIADYLADTAHLRAAQSGAYLHLIMHYWQHGGVPNDNAQLAAIARMTDAEWKKTRPIIEPFFQMPGWKHKRVEEEIVKADAKYEQRVNAGKAGGTAKANARQKPSESLAVATPPLERKQSEIVAKSYQPQPQPQEDGGRDGSAREPMKPEPKKAGLISEDAFKLSTEILTLMGLDPEHPISVGAAYTTQSWLNGGWPPEAIKTGIQKAMQSRGGDPPGTLKYFEKAIARSHAELTRVLPKVEIKPGETTTERPSGKANRPGGSLIAAIDADIARTIEEINRAERNEGSVLSLSAGSVH